MQVSLVELLGSILISVSVVLFFLGGEYSPLSIFKWYGKFISSIGLGREKNV